MSELLDRDIAVNLAVAQARAFQRDDQDRHLVAIGDVINRTEDPLETAKHVARRCGRKLAIQFLDAKIVEAGARGWFK